MENKLSEYEKMPDSLNKLGFSDAEFSELKKITWVVTEKVHGANFSFVYANGLLKFAKRKEFLSWTDDFFGFQLVVNRLENKVLRLFEQLEKDLPARKWQIYGELFGGHYPHPDVPAKENLFPIQTGVYYSPDIHFCAL